MLPGARSSEGVLYTVDGVSPGVANTQGGIAVDITTGALCTTIVTNSTDTFVNGFRVNEFGAVVMQAGTPVTWQEGIGRNAAGAIVFQINAPAPSSKYLGGLRLDSVGRVHVTNSPPVTNRAFSSGFSAGFQ